MVDATSSDYPPNIPVPTDTPPAGEPVQTGEPEQVGDARKPEPILEEIPAWAHRIAQDLKTFWTDQIEHHNRLENLISDLRKYGIPLAATAEHYAGYGAPLPAATPDTPGPDTAGEQPASL
jgi:hypothetical protein